MQYEMNSLKKKQPAIGKLKSVIDYKVFLISDSSKLHKIVRCTIKVECCPIYRRVEEKSHLTLLKLYDQS